MQWVVERRAVTSAGTLVTTRRILPPRPCAEVFASERKGVPCYGPIKCWRLPGRGVVFSEGMAYQGAIPMQIACGQCLGCRIAKSKEWATRITHEAQMHKANSFITLTYAEEHLPLDGGLSIRECQLFLKRLRKQTGAALRYFIVGEYGDSRGRPHYHAIIFGYDFLGDRVLWRTSPNGFPLYRSPELERIWPYGHCEIGSVTPDSAGYCARYALKKITSGTDRGASLVTRPHPTTGELHSVIPEFARMSRRPGIGASWFDEYRRDLFPSGFVVLDGTKRAIPSYYIARANLSEREQLIRLQKARIEARRTAHERTPERLAAREELQVYKQSKLEREPTQ